MAYYSLFPLSIAPLAKELLAFATGNPPVGPSTGFLVDIAGERLAAPDYVSAEPDAVRARLARLSGDARLLLLCLCTFHCNGYFREECLRQLAGADRDWVLPFVVARLGDRVIQVGLAAVETLRAFDTAALVAFACVNPAFMTATRSRAASCWGEHGRWVYARSRRVCDYPPVAVLRSIDKVLRADRKNAPKSSKVSSSTS